MSLNPEHARVVLVTGPPGVGKTTLIQQIHDQYRNKGINVAGITTREVREGDKRIGFKITNISSGAEGWLARAGDGPGPRVGKYKVVTKYLDSIGVVALKQAIDQPNDLVLIDEIGPMEMTSRAFREALADLLSKRGEVVATVKYGSHYPELARVPAVNLVSFEISRENREEVYEKITAIVDYWKAPKNEVADPGQM